MTRVLTVMEVMVTVVWPVMPFSDAYTVTDLLLDFLVRKMPLLVTTAYRPLLVLQETPERTSCDPSLKLPIAVSWTFDCGGRMRVDGEMVMESSFAVMTDNVVDPLTAPKLAVTVVVPALIPLATPAASMSAAAAFEENQTACEVMA